MNLSGSFFSASAAIYTGTPLFAVEMLSVFFLLFKSPLSPTCAAAVRYPAREEEKEELGGVPSSSGNFLHVSPLNPDARPWPSLLYGDSSY